MAQRRLLVGLGLMAAFQLSLAMAEAGGRPKGPPCNGILKKVDGKIVTAACPKLWEFDAKDAKVILNKKKSTLDDLKKIGDLKQKGEVEITIYWRRDSGRLYAEKIVWPAEPQK
jgi:hypothetical protein